MLHAEYCRVTQVWRIIVRSPGAYYESNLLDLDGQWSWQTREELLADLERKGLTLTDSNTIITPKT